MMNGGEFRCQKKVLQLRDQIGDSKRYKNRQQYKLQSSCRTLHSLTVISCRQRGKRIYKSVMKEEDKYFYDANKKTRKKTIKSSPFVEGLQKRIGIFLGKTRSQFIISWDLKKRFFLFLGSKIHFYRLCFTAKVPPINKI